MWQLRSSSLSSSLSLSNGVQELREQQQQYQSFPSQLTNGDPTTRPGSKLEGGTVIAAPDSNVTMSIRNGDDGIDNNDDHDHDDSWLDWNAVSDAEALLACRAYLSRKHVTPWMGKVRRQQQRAVALASMTSNDMNDDDHDDSSRGYFWHNPTQLTYYQRPNAVAVLSATIATNQTTEYSILSNGSNTTKATNASTYVYEHDDDGDYDLEDEYWSPNEPRYQGSNEYLEEFEQRACQQHVSRSQRLQARFADPAWKAMWYQKRWGHLHRQKDDRTMATHTRRLQLQLRQINVDRFLALPELAAMSHDEIATAIRIFLRSKRRRSQYYLQKRQQKQKQQLLMELQPNFTNPVAMNGATRSTNHVRNWTSVGAFSIPSSSSRSNLTAPKGTENGGIPTPEQLVLARHRRSERAVRAYQTRLRNQRAAAAVAIAEAAVVALQQASSSSSLRDYKNESTTLTEWLHEETCRRRQLQRQSQINNETGVVAVDAAAASSSSSSSISLSPQDALKRVEADLDCGCMPTAHDVHMMMQCQRLSHRRWVLRRCLLEQFDLRGKCVPRFLPRADVNVDTTRYTVTSNSTTTTSTAMMMTLPETTSTSAFIYHDDWEFVTKAPIETLGAFVLSKIEEARKHPHNQQCAWGVDVEQ